jgi:hypothetical protein
LMKNAMDSVSFQRGGAEVHMRKAGRKQETPAWRAPNGASGPLVSRPSRGSVLSSYMSGHEPRSCHELRVVRQRQ